MAKVKEIFDYTKDELGEMLAAKGVKPYRTKQIFSWLHAKGARSFDDMTDIPKDLRVSLAADHSIGALSIETVQKSKLDGTRKYLFRLYDGGLIEGVFMEYRDWNTVCISSQVGCAMGCRFCASTVKGCERDMTAGEMALEIYEMERDAGKRISNVVVMGSGEPLLNYENLMRFTDIITDSDGKGISQRNITVSTCGIVPAIERLAGEKLHGDHLQINLAISLHAATDEKRRKLMPVAKKYDLKQLMGAADRYYDSTHRRLTFEYALIEGENDSEGDAKELARLLKGKNALLNLIPVNPVTESGLKRPDRRKCEAFKNKLENFGINGSIRRELGSDIDGACGQLRMRSTAEISRMRV
ncbi:MAG: 23S rRNA (adenine(2503)-C(2))-methyltransferase RlmN [Lachnospiraceae bacterium]|nr:23S rRNA (adenine(2503)-C(2))-methyltransferase RlmN [Lachnospiraceae bacterium]